MTEPARRGADLPWDTSTLRKGLQRKFFASLLEMNGSTVQIVQRTAAELARLVEPAAPAEGLKQLLATRSPGRRRVGWSTERVHRLSWNAA